jgi:hypothetical protein
MDMMHLITDIPFYIRIQEIRAMEALCAWKSSSLRLIGSQIALNESMVESDPFQCNYILPSNRRLRSLNGTNSGRRLFSFSGTYGPEIAVHSSGGCDFRGLFPTSMVSVQFRNHPFTVDPILIPLWIDVL